MEDNIMSMENTRQDSRLVGEADSVVLEVDDHHDEWPDAGLPRGDRWLSSQRSRLKRFFFVIVGATALFLVIRQGFYWFGIRSPTSPNDAPIGPVSKGANTTILPPTDILPPSSEAPPPPTKSPVTVGTSSGPPMSHPDSTEPDPNLPQPLPDLPEPLPNSPEPEVSTNVTPPASLEPLPNSPELEVSTNVTQAFSVLDPVIDLGILAVDRPAGSKPPQILHPLQEKHGALPTNAWYQNLLMIEDNIDPGSINRAYVMPYVVDAGGPIVGLRTIPGRLQVGDSTAEYMTDDNFGLTMGLTANLNDTSPSRRYMVRDATQLAVTLEWDEGSMTSPIVRGMPYTTAIYDKQKHMATNAPPHFPSIASELPVESVRIDNQDALLEDGDVTWVEHEMEITVPTSDFTWLIFVSERLQIRRASASFGTVLQVVSWESSETTNNFSLRVALSKTCSSGRNPIFCQQEYRDYAGRKDGYSELLRKHAHIYPGPNASFSFELFHEEEEKSRLTFDWDAKFTSYTHPVASGDEGVLAFALPHHLEMEFSTGSRTEEWFCWDSLLGWNCALNGSIWEVIETLTSVSFRAPRSPLPWAIPALASSLGTDIHYRVADNYRRGAGDTYFSGKMLAKMARIMVIAEEVKELCENPTLPYYDSCSGSSLPTDDSMRSALEALRESLDIWLSQASEAPFVYDSSWGGVPSCGCYFDGVGCGNKYPHCPAFSDPGLNFGNGFYNDQHFHYGYFIYSAAVVSHFDPTWGENNYEKVLLLVRSIANPSRADRFFPVLRHVDPFRGHSFASGITMPVFRNGRNQESSSEAIASYEAVALYGATMSQLFDRKGMEEKKRSAESVHIVGRTILSMELRSARRYWQIYHERDDGDLYEGYRHGVVGILWQTMFQFQTFFGTAPYLVYGIQLLPLTPASEQRDGLDWIRSSYSDFAASCTGDCVSSGWSIQQIAVLATGGHASDALDKVNALPDHAFETSGGNGHSRSNTLWYISTRPEVKDPIAVVPVTVPSTNPPPAPVEPLAITCDKPETCTSDVLDKDAGGYSCGARIRWLITTLNFSEQDACSQVAGDEFPDECNGCY